MYALTGSTVSKPEDINSANGPIGFIEVAGFYLAYFTNFCDKKIVATAL